MDGEESEGAGTVCGAAAAGDADELKLLLDAGEPAAATDPYGVPALVIACCMGHAACAALLLEHGADPNAGNGLGGQRR